MRGNARAHGAGAEDSYPAKCPRHTSTMKFKFWSHRSRAEVVDSIV